MKGFTRRVLGFPSHEDTHISTRRLGLILRTLLRRPRFTATVVITLGVAFGVIGAVSTVVHVVLVESLPSASPGRLAVLETGIASMGLGAQRLPNSAPLFLDLDRRLDVAEVGGYELDAVNLETDDPVRADVARVTSGFFRVLGVDAHRGRTFALRDDRPGGEPVTVLSHAFWQDRFGADPATIGTVLDLDGVPHRVLGVLPAGFAFPLEGIDLYVHRTVDPTLLTDRTARGDHRLHTVARLRSGAGPADLDAALASFTRWLHDSYPVYEPRFGFTVRARPFREALLGHLRLPLLAVLGGAVLVLLIAGTNVANLLLLRNEERLGDLHLRHALGGSRGTVVRSVLSEAVVLGLLSGALGVAVCQGALAAMGGSLTSLPAWSDPGSFDAARAGWIFALGLSTGVVVGAFAAVRALRSMRGGSLRLGRGRVGAAPPGSRVRRGLVTVQVTIAVALLVGAGLLVRSLAGLRAVDPGYEPAGAVVASVSLPELRYPEVVDIVRFHRELGDELEAIPGVSSVGTTDFMPLQGAGEPVPYEIEGIPEDEEGVDEPAVWQMVTPGYFEAAGLRIVRGRPFTAEDREGDRPAILINETLARRHFADEDPIGRRITIFRDEPRTVVGVVEDVTVSGLAEAPPLHLYGPLDQFPAGEFWHTDLVRLVRESSVVLRVSDGATAVVDDVREVLATLDPRLPMSQVVRGTDLVEGSVARSRSLSLLFGVFAGVSLALSLLGVYAVLAWEVTSRRREIGVRRAFGATVGRIRGEIVRKGMRPVGLGLVLGLSVAGIASAALEALLYGVRPLDPVTYAGVTCLVVATAGGALVLSGRRVYRADPVEVLRSD